MCIAVPGRVLETREGRALVDVDGVSRRVINVAVPEARPGDYVLISLGMVVERVTEAEARQMRDLWRDVAASQERLMEGLESEEDNAGG